MKIQRVFTLLLVSSICIVVNAQSIVFEEVPAASTNFLGVADGSVAFADVDNDSDQDVVITGGSLYLNNGTGEFTLDANTSFNWVSHSAIAFADVDGDSDQDLLMTGDAFGGTASTLYINDGSGVFTEAMGTPFIGVKYSAIAFADVENDGDQDVLITGQYQSSGYYSRLYINDGNGVFSVDATAEFDDVFKGDVAFADIDGDNDQDVLITGFSSAATRIAKLYTNDGNGTFTESLASTFDGTELGSVTFADIDNDNDPDVLITGWTESFDFVADLYQNDGAGVFSLVVGDPLDGVKWGTGNFSDFDEDNDLDLIITGKGTTNEYLSLLYENDGTGGFSPVFPTVFEGVTEGAVAIADVDGQNGPDVLITGVNTLGESTARLYRNTTAVGIGEVSFISEKLIYPNPSSGLVNIELNAQGRTSIKVYDQLGHLLYEDLTVAGSKYQFYLNERPGLYFVELTLDDGKQYSKLLIE